MYLFFSTESMFAACIGVKWFTPELEIIREILQLSDTDMFTKYWYMSLSMCLIKY